jgi:hypothetical protein
VTQGDRVLEGFRPGNGQSTGRHDANAANRPVDRQVDDGRRECPNVSDLLLTVDGRTLTASWTDENGDTRAAIRDALPLGGDPARWGDELYFSIPVDVDPETTRTAVPVGSLAYWPTGNALCLFWGSSPASRDTEPRAAGPVAVVATVTDVSPLASLQGGAHVRVEPATAAN